MQKLEDNLREYQTFLENPIHNSIPQEIYRALGGNPKTSGGYVYIKMCDIPSIEDLFITTFQTTKSPEEKKRDIVGLYKIHIMPKTTDIVKVVSQLIKHQNKIDGFKVKEIMYGVDEDNRMPIIVIYSNGGQRKAQAVLQMVCRLFRGMNGIDITPRFNKKVNSLIYFAQGNADDKIPGKSPYYNENNYTKDKIYYSEELNKQGKNIPYELSISGCR